MVFKNNPAAFNGVTSIQKDNLTNNLLLGVQDFLSWGFLNVGAFQNISRDPAVSGSYPDSHSRYRLRICDDPNYEYGSVWEGFRNDWVWESGVGYDGAKPINVSGVWVEDNYYKLTDSSFSHFVDYPNGRVIFDYPISDTTKIEANFSHRTVGVCLASKPFVRELMYDSYDMEDLNTYLIASSGVRNQTGETRLQLPFVALEIAQGGKSTPYQLGGGRIAENDILFHIFSDNEFEKNNIRDVILNQNEKVFYLINRGLMKTEKRRKNYPGCKGHSYPHQLDSNGSPVGSALMYTDLISPTGDPSYGMRWKATRIDKTTCSDMEPVNNWLYRSTVRGTFSVIMGVNENIAQVE